MKSLSLYEATTAEAGPEGVMSDKVNAAVARRSAIDFIRASYGRNHSLRASLHRLRAFTTTFTKVCFLEASGESVGASKAARRDRSHAIGRGGGASASTNRSAPSARRFGRMPFERSGFPTP